MALFLLLGGTAPAQKGVPSAINTPELKPPSFPLLFPNPTGNNGYEEWVQAVDLIQNNPKVLELTSQPGTTLAFRRSLLAEPSVERALYLVRVGLSKPTFSPRQDINEVTITPELASFRLLARLLSADQYVQFATGHVDAAIEDMRVGLAFGYRIQTDTLISGLVGVAMDAITLKEFTQHLDQLSVSQCDQVCRIVEDFLNAESPAIHLMALEKATMLKIIEARRSNPNALLALLKLNGANGPSSEAKDIEALQSHLTNHPSDLNPILEGAQERVNALYDVTILNLSLPYTQRKPFPRDNATSPDAALFRLLTVDPLQIMDKYERDRTQLRMLEVHALICRYRWQHDTLPNALTDLRAPKLVKDPLTGSEILYQRDGDHYTLSTQGPGKTLQP